MFENILYVASISFVLLGVLFGLYFIIVVPSRESHMHELLSKSNYSDAILVLKDIVKKEPFNTKALFDLSELYWITENFVEASKIYQQLAFKNIPTVMNDTISIRLAQLNIKNRQFASAKITLENLLKKNPKNIEGLALLGDIYFEHKDYQESINTYKKALSLNKDNFHCWKYLSKSYFNSGMYIDAYKSFANALNIDPQNAELWYYAAESHLLLEDLDKALRFFLKVEQFTDSVFSFKTLLKISDIHHIKQNDDMYVQFLEKARSIIQKNESPFTLDRKDILEVHYRLGEVYSKSNHPELALDEWESILEIDPFYKDVSKRYRSYYAEFVDDLFKDMLMSQGEELIEVLSEFLKTLNYTIEGVQQANSISIDFYVSESSASWHKKNKVIISFWCSEEPVPSDVITFVSSKISQQITKAIIIAPRPFLYETKEMLKARSIDVYDKTTLKEFISERKKS